MGRDRLRLTVVVALLAACSLSACGRKGGLDPPPDAAAVPVVPQAAAAPPPAGTELFPHSTTAQSQAAQKNGFDANGNPIAPPGEKRGFFLDFLLN